MIETSFFYGWIPLIILIGVILAYFFKKWKINKIERYQNKIIEKDLEEYYHKRENRMKKNH